MKNSKILFVTPPYRCGVVDVIGRWLPLGFVYLAGSARLAGLAAEIYDARTKGHGYQEIEQQLRRSAASYVAVTAITATINDAIRVLELAKSVNPQVVTLLGGIHPTFFSEELLQASPAVDYIICGAGETPLRGLLQSLESGGDPAAIPGLAFRRDGGVVRTAVSSSVAELDTLPAAWDLVDWPDYEYYVLPGSRLGAICTSRDSGPVSIDSFSRHAGVRQRLFRDPHKIVDEMVQLHLSYAVNIFLITDEYPTEDRERWEMFLDLLLERDLPIYLLMQAGSADIVRDRDIIWKYRKAGVIHIYVVIESAERNLPDLVENGSGLPQGKLALDIVREHGIISETSFVVGGPDETRAGVEQTLKLARYYNPDNVQFLAFTPWPYDPQYAAVRQYVRVDDYSKYNLIDPVVEPRQMSLLQVDVAMVDCYRRFYMGKIMEIVTMKNTFKRDYLLAAMKLMMISPFIIKKLGMGTLGKVPASIGDMLGRKV